MDVSDIKTEVGHVKQLPANKLHEKGVAVTENDHEKVTSINNTKCVFGKKGNIFVGDR